MADPAADGSASENPSRVTLPSQLRPNSLSFSRVCWSRCRLYVLLALRREWQERRQTQCRD